MDKNRYRNGDDSRKHADWPQSWSGCSKAQDASRWRPRPQPPPWARKSAATPSRPPSKTWSNAGGSRCMEPGGDPSTRANKPPFCNVCVGSLHRDGPFFAGFRGKGAEEMPAGPRFDRNYRHGRYFSGGYGPSLSVYRHQPCILVPKGVPGSRPGIGGEAEGGKHYRHCRYEIPTWTLFYPIALPTLMLQNTDMDVAKKAPITDMDVAKYRHRRYFLACNPLIIKSFPAPKEKVYMLLKEKHQHREAPLEKGPGSDDDFSVLKKGRRDVEQIP